MTERLQTPSEKLLADILVPNKKLTAFIVELTPALKEALEKSHQRQEEMIKRKEVDEDILRMVVKF